MIAKITQVFCFLSQLLGALLQSQHTWVHSHYLMALMLQLTKYWQNDEHILPDKLQTWVRIMRQWKNESKSYCFRYRKFWFLKTLVVIKNVDGGRAAQHRGIVRSSHPAVPGSILCIPDNFSERKINSIQQRFIDSPAKRQVDRGLIMSTEPIKYRLMANQCYKKTRMLFFS